MTMLEKARDAVMREAGIDEFAAGLAVRAVLMAVRAPEIGTWIDADCDDDTHPISCFTAMIDAILDGK